MIPTLSTPELQYEFSKNRLICFYKDHPLYQQARKIVRNFSEKARLKKIEVVCTTEYMSREEWWQSYQGHKQDLGIEWDELDEYLLEQTLDIDEEDDILGDIGNLIGDLK